jgi:hypothetical protein
MFKPNSLHILIQALSKSEKRHFRLYAKRNFGDKKVKFLDLFDCFDKQVEYDSAKIRARFSDTSVSALANLKSHLYEQLLVSLRLLKHNDASIRIHELLSFANVLYSKGLYLQSLEQLKRARVFASVTQDDISLYAIVEMERKLELFFVTESGENRALEIVEMNEHLRTNLLVRDSWANVALILYEYYLKYGHVKNELQFKKATALFEEKIKNIAKGDSSIQGKIYYHMSYTWYYFITQNFAQCYRHAREWIELLESNKVLLNRDPIFYLKGIHNTLSALYYSNKPRQFGELFHRFNTFINDNLTNFDVSTRILAEVYQHLAKLNYLFLKGAFRGNDQFIVELNKWTNENKAYLDQNRVQVFYYKIACLYFGTDDFKNCILYLNKVIHDGVKEKYLRQDVQCFSRILNLVAHYELGNDELVEYQLKSVYRYLIKFGDLQKVQKEIILFIRKTVYFQRSEMIPHFIELKEKLTTIVEDPYERRPLLYLDLIGWLTSRIKGVSVESIIQFRQKDR